MTSAWIRIECAAGTVLDTAAALVGDPGVLTVQHITGGADLVAFLACPDATALDRYLVERLHRLPGVRATRTHVVTGVYGSAHPPPLNQLTPQQLRRVRELHPRAARSGRAAPPSGPPDALDQRLLLALGADGRAGVAALAKQVGSSESTVRRRLTRMEATGALLFRTEVAPHTSGRPVWCLVCAEVPPEQVASAAASIARLRETRTVTAVTGPHNLFISGRLGRVEQLPEYTQKLTHKAPGLRVADTVLALRVHKVNAHVLGADGLREGFVPPDIWGISPAA
ncbi:Lrp/AsnC ligand binding domain-containing protein [Streptomyces sp. Q6]|uniref:Lrp/AsnC ligand binding domain-containing protein n=1 Tax=Streptomyces citrinus TaxID=3118173 RepID=A0ACD5AE87_9ACTN